MREMAAVKEREYIYAEGNTLRRGTASMPVRKEAEHTVSEGTLANRERSLQMNLGYVVFLTAAAVLTVFICVNYLRLRSEYTALQKEATSLELDLSSLKMDNDAEYNRLISGVNLEDVKNTAMTRLGMVYACEDQIVTYDAAGKDYVKQFRDIPG